VLFISGDGGWNKGVVDMARRLAPESLVVGLSMPAWQKVVEKETGRCWYPAGDLETAAQIVEKKYALPRYVRPILVGYSSGATVVYGALAQAPSTTFAGAVSLGFCPDIEVGRPLCARGDWKPSYDAKKRTSLLPVRSDLEPRPDGEARFIALLGDVDKVCDPKMVGDFITQIPAARLVALPKVGHGFSVPRNWAAAYDSAVSSLLEASSPWQPTPEPSRRHVPDHSPAEIRERLDALGLPLEIEWPAHEASPAAAVIFISGDGGWADIDQSVASALSGAGVAVVGWNSLRYFWSAKTPGTFRDDLARVIEALPTEMRLFAGGYSFGAEVTPVALETGGAAERSPALARVAGLVLLAPGPYASFEISPLDWLRSSEAPTQHSVSEAIAASRSASILCLHGSDDRESGCPAAGRGVTTVTLPGGHHFGGDYDGIAARILEFMNGAPPRS
jgi:type IV secretory pathway VirJ component